MGVCKVCSSNYHYCSSCGDIPAHDFGLCYKCWINYGFEGVYERAKERADAIIEEAEENISQVIKAICNGVSLEGT